MITRTELLLASLFITATLHAQTDDVDVADPATLAGYNRMGLYAGGNAVLNSLNDGAIPTINSTSNPAKSPSGVGFVWGVVYARLLPNLFLTRPANAEEEADPRRLYRKITTFELRFLASAITGTSSAHDYYPIHGNSESLYVEQRVRSLIYMLTLEPQFLFDLAPMRRSTSGFLSLGASLGYIMEAHLDSKVTPAEPISDPVPLPSSGGEPYDARSFYAALLLGGGVHIGLGGDVRTATALVPSASLIIPFTSIGNHSRWLPFGIRFGMAVYWPV